MRSKLHFVMMAASLVAAAQELPDGKGKEQVIKICSDCHEIGTVIGSRNTRIGWQRTVEDMVSRGAEGSEEDMAAVVDYLTRFFGKINVNTASAKEIQSFLGLPDKEAQAIVTYRERNGNFKGFEQLTQVPGVDGAKLQAKRSLIAFSL